MGDMVKVDSAGNCDLVYSLAHYTENEKSSYLQIHAGNKPLEISKDHMLFVADEKFQKRAIIASQVRVGDLLFTDAGESAEVIKISQVERMGAYAPFTRSGTIVVSSIMSSSYVSIQSSSAVWIMDKKTSISSHFPAHFFTTPLRVMS
jgi:hypothetical protein